MISFLAIDLNAYGTVVITFSKSRGGFHCKKGCVDVQVYKRHFTILRAAHRKAPHCTCKSYITKLQTKILRIFFLYKKNVVFSLNDLS